MSEVIYDDLESTCKGGSCPKFVLQDDGSVVLMDTSGHSARMEKAEFNRFVEAVRAGVVKPL